MPTTCIPQLWPCPRELLYRYKVILDYHGRIPEEYVYLGKGGEPSRKALEGLERWTVTNSDHVVAGLRQAARVRVGAIYDSGVEDFGNSLLCGRTHVQLEH